MRHLNCNMSIFISGDPKDYSINMGIQPVLIYDISGLEPKFHWDGMKNE